MPTKESICPRCKKAREEKKPIEMRKCDEGDCGRVSCVHLVKHLGGNRDICGPCNLAISKERKAAKGKPAEKPEGDEAAK